MFIVVYPPGYGSKRKASSTIGFGLFFFLPIGFFRHPFLTHGHQCPGSCMASFIGVHHVCMLFTLYLLPSFGDAIMFATPLLIYLFE